MHKYIHIILWLILTADVTSIYAEKGELMNILNNNAEKFNFTAPKNELSHIVTTWKNFLQINSWEKLIENVEPHLCGCGLVYSLPNYLQRPNESFAIADMRSIQYSEPHYHSAGVTEIYFIVQGCGIVIVGSEEYTVKTGNVIVIPPLTAHYVIPDKDCVLAVVNKPVFSIADYHVITETNNAVRLYKEQFLRLAKGTIKYDKIIK